MQMTPLDTLVREIEGRLEVAGPGPSHPIFLAHARTDLARLLKIVQCLREGLIEISKETKTPYERIALKALAAANMLAEGE